MGQNKEQSQPFVSLSGQTKMYLQLWKDPFSPKISLSMRKGALWNWKWFYLYPSIHDKLYSDYELKTPEAEDMDFMKRIQIKFS